MNQEIETIIKKSIEQSFDELKENLIEVINDNIKELTQEIELLRNNVQELKREIKQKTNFINEDISYLQQRINDRIANQHHFSRLSPEYSPHRTRDDTSGFNSYEKRPRHPFFK